MTIQDITCFMKLAETLSYTKAAQQLYISQPAVTQHIHSLERELGVQLFDRSVKRAIVLTESGVLYYNGLKECEETYHNTLQMISQHADQVTILINLMRGTTYPDRYIPVTTAFMEKHLQDFKHFTNFIDYEDFPDCLNRGEVLICSEEFIPKGNYESMKLTQNAVPYCIVASKGHRAFADEKNVRLDEIIDTTLFLPKMLPTTLREALAGTILSLFGRMPKETIYLDSVDSVSLFLRSNECFTICTAWHSDAQSSDFRRVPIPLFTDYYALWRGDKLKNPVAREYLEALKLSDM